MPGTSSRTPIGGGDGAAAAAAAVDTPGDDFNTELGTLSYGGRERGREKVPSSVGVWTTEPLVPFLQG